MTYGKTEIDENSMDFPLPWTHYLLALNIDALKQEIELRKSGILNFGKLKKLHKTSNYSWMWKNRVGGVFGEFPKGYVQDVKPVNLTSVPEEWENKCVCPKCGGKGSTLREHWEEEESHYTQAELTSWRIDHEAYLYDPQMNPGGPISSTPPARRYKVTTQENCNFCVGRGVIRVKRDFFYEFNNKCNWFNSNVEEINARIKILNQATRCKPKKTG